MADSDPQKDPTAANDQSAAENPPPQPPDSASSNGEPAAETASNAAASKEPTDDGDDAAEGDGEQNEAGDSNTAAEEPAEEPAEPTLEEQLDAAKKETKATKERMLRVAADFENFRKRAHRDANATRKRGMQSAVRELLPVFDNLERAAGHGTDATDAKSIADGVRMVQKMFIDTIGKLDVKRIDALGKPFDPMVHEGIQHDYSDEYPAGAIMTVFHPGYTMGKDLLRPALVVVSRGPKPPEPPPVEDSEAADEPDSEPAEGEQDDEQPISQPAASGSTAASESTAASDDESREADAAPNPSGGDEE